MRTRFRGFLTLLSVTVMAGATLVGAQRGMTPHDIAKLRGVGAAKISPDGSHIAYLLTVPRQVGVEDNGTAWSELHVIDVEGGASRPFVTGEVRASQLGWTPDGRYISFVTKRNDDKHNSLYVIPIDGGEARRAAAMASNIAAYTWSPDGKRVALIAVPSITKERKELKEKGFNQEIYEEDWRHRQIFIAKAFFDQEPTRLDVQGSVFAAVWNPAGSRLALAISPRPLVDDRYMLQSVEIVDARTSEPTGHVKTAGKLGSMVWSPNGKRLALIGSSDINDPAAGRLLVATVSGGAAPDILKNHLGHVSAVAWQSNDTIIFLNNQGVQTALEKVGIQGARKRLSSYDGPALTSLSVSRDGRRAVMVGSTPRHPAEVFYMKHGDAQPKRMTDSNPWLSKIRLATQETVRFKARDGLELEGLLVRPLDEVQGRRYPLVMMVHGGPESHHRNGWLTSYSLPSQVLAARGIASFYTNYRGSTGRGVEFSKLSQADPAGKEFDDLVDAVDHLIASGLVDRDKVGVTGGSYGGYATAWLSTRYSDRFAAGVMFVGISDKISKVGTTDIPDEEYLVHARKRPWDNWQFFLERSPIYHAGNGKTPLLILHGKDDPRVNVGQSRELYRHLKLRSTAPVRLVLYPGEEHGNRKAAARLDYSLRSIRWLEHYLTGSGGHPPDWKIDYQAGDPEAPSKDVPTPGARNDGRTKR